MSNTNTKKVDRRSTRSLNLRHLEKPNEEIDLIKTRENFPEDIEVTDEESTAVLKKLDIGTNEPILSNKDPQDDQDMSHIENIPDNTQVISPRNTDDTPNPNFNVKKDKKVGYRKKPMKHGITDREYLGSKEHREKWTALDAKRGMCNDCKKVFSSRQVKME